MKGIGNLRAAARWRSWIFTVLINTAKTRGQRERRDEQNRREIYGGRTVDPARFSPAGERWAGHWRDDAQPQPSRTPGNPALAAELMALARSELDKLPERQRAVVTLRDLVGMESQEVCELLELTPANQRVLLPPWPVRDRDALENYVTGVQ